MRGSSSADPVATVGPDSPRSPRILGGRPQSLFAGLVKACVVLACCLVLTSAAFVVLTHGKLSSTPVDRALHVMYELIASVERGLSAYYGPLPVRLLTAPAHTPVLPVGSLPRALDNFVDPPVAVPRAAQIDPWGHSYLLVVRKHGRRVRVSCLSPGPNGAFESDPCKLAAAGDDLMVHAEVDG
jgi:hypothetical protein